MKITLDLTIRQAMVPWEQVLELSIQDDYPATEEKGFWKAIRDEPTKFVAVWDGDEVIVLTTVGRLRSHCLLQTWKTLEQGLVRRSPFARVQANERVFAVATLARSLVGQDHPVAMVVDEETGRPVGAIDARHVADPLSRLEMEGWPGGWQNELELDAVLYVPGGATLGELAEQVRTITVDDTALVASYDEDNGRWVVCGLDDLLGAIHVMRPPPAKGYQVSGLFARLPVALAQLLPLDEADWDTVQSLLPPDARMRVLLAERDVPVFALRRKSTRAMRSAKSALGDMGIQEFVDQFGVTPTEGHQGRVVNTWFADRGEVPVPPRHALAANTLYLLGVNIGAPDKEKTNVVTEQPEIAPKIIAAALASGEDLVLRVDSEDFYVRVREQTVNLPQRGDTAPVHFQIVTPVQTGVSHLRLGVYLRGNLVQSYQVYARIAPTQGEIPAEGVDGWWSACEYTLSMDLNDVQGLTSRDVCVWFGAGKEGAHRAGVRAAGLDAGPALEVDPVLRRSALERYRELLYDACFEEKPGDQGEEVRREYRYHPDHTPRDPETFRETLLDLVELGQMLYQRVFGTREGQRVADAIRQVEKNQVGGPLVVQIARMSLDATFPWAVLYDRPLHYHPGSNEICQEFLKGSDCSKNCSKNDLNLVCPYGFWGFRYIIEQPLRPPGSFSSVATELSVEGSPRMTLVYGSDLELTEKHSKAVSDVLGSQAQVVTPKGTTELVKEIECGPAVVYFYCHGGNKPYRHWLVLDKGDPLVPTYLHDGLCEAWSGGAPLFVLNGCHTGKFDPSTILSFVHRLGTLGAGGVIGTEVMIHEYLGSAFGEFLFKHLVQGGQVGQIVYDFRRELLISRNLLGLVYVPYCYVDLRIVQRSA
jgi:hypothetical protein